MIGKKFILVIGVGVIFLGFSSSAFAELFSVSAGIPISYTLADTKSVEPDGRPSGILLHVKLPIMIGLGYEGYKVPLKHKNANTKDDFKLSMTMYDLFYQFPVPAVNITLGIGTGTSELECTGCSDYYKKGTATQFYGQLGIPIFAVMDIHLSYHSIKSTIKPEDRYKLADDQNVGGTMVALGMSFGF